MKVIIDGQTVEVKTVENMGFQGGYYTRAVMYNGKEVIVQRINGVWQTRTSSMRVEPLMKGLFDIDILERLNDKT